MGMLLCFLIVFAPKIYVVYLGGGYIKENERSEYAITRIRWDLVLQRSLVVLLIGGLLIYTLKNKKK